LLLTIQGLLLYLTAFRAILGPQFQMALPPLTIAMAFLLERCVDAVKEAARKQSIALRAACGATLLVASLAYLATSEKRFFGSLGGWVYYQQTKALMAPGLAAPHPVAIEDRVALACERCGGVQVPRVQQEEMDGVTTFLREHTRPDEAVFTFPEHGIFNFLADRPGVSRFDIAGLAWTTPQWRRELLGALERAAPRFVVRGRGLSALARSIQRREELLPEIDAYLQAHHYELVREFPLVLILERRP
jgi:hypothetical protein